jgi:hypothetical protein
MDYLKKLVENKNPSSSTAAPVLSIAMQRTKLIDEITDELEKIKNDNQIYDYYTNEIIDISTENRLPITSSFQNLIDDFQKINIKNNNNNVIFMSFNMKNYTSKENDLLIPPNKKFDKLIAALNRILFKFANPTGKQNKRFVDPQTQVITIIRTGNLGASQEFADINAEFKLIKGGDFELEKTIQEFNDVNFPMGLPSAATRSSGTGFKSKLKKQIKKRRDISKPIYKIITGSGAISEKSNYENGTHIMRGEYYPVNKFMLSKNDLDHNLIRLKYQNGKSLKPMKISDDNKIMIQDVAKHNKFNLVQYNKMSDNDKELFSKFCELSHINIDLPQNTKKAENDYKIYLGEYHAGNKMPLLNYVHNLFISKKITKEEYNKTINSMI